MANMLLLALCLLIGVCLRRYGRVPDNAASVLNSFIINVSLPAMILLHVRRLEPSADLLFPVLMPWIMFAVGFLFFRVVGRLVPMTKASMGALILTGSLANTSFVGIPMIEAFYGNHYNELAVGMLIDQLGTYMVLSTLGILVAVLYSGTGRVSSLSVIRKIALFPPFITLVVALVTVPIPTNPGLDAILDKLAVTLTPLALVSVGLQLRLNEIKGRTGPLTAGLFFSLLAAPAIIFSLFAGFAGAGGRLIQVTIFEAAMPPQIGAAIVAMEHKMEPALVALMVGIGIPLSFLTVLGWYHVLERLAI